MKRIELNLIYNMKLLLLKTKNQTVIRNLLLYNFFKQPIFATVVIIVLLKFVFCFVDLD